jgi:hypothetical protein
MPLLAPVMITILSFILSFFSNNIIDIRTKKAGYSFLIKGWTLTLESIKKP